MMSYSVLTSGRTAVITLHKDISSTVLLHAIHKHLARFTAIVVLGHLAMALKHHLVDRDDTQRGMPPRGQAAREGLTDPATSLDACSS